MTEPNTATDRAQAYIKEARPLGRLEDGPLHMVALLVDLLVGIQAAARRLEAMEATQMALLEAVQQLAQAKAGKAKAGRA